MTQKEFIVNIFDKDNEVNEKTMNFKEHDYEKIIDILNVICKSIEIIPEIVFEKIELLDDEYENEKMIRNIPIENSRVIKLRIHFKLIDQDGNIRIDDKTKKELRPTIDLFIPRLINGTFHLFDVTYYSMLQILDFNSIIRDNSVTIKTLINRMRLEVKRNRKRIHRVELELFRRKDMPLWLVLFCLYKPIEALKRVLCTSNIYLEDINETNVEEPTNIPFGNKVICIPDIQQAINDNPEKAYSISVMFESLREFAYDKNTEKYIYKITNMEDQSFILDSSEQYATILGSYYTSNPNKFNQKGMNVTHSLNRFLDDISKFYMGVDDMLDMYIKEIEKINKYNIENDENDNEMLDKNQPNNLLNKRVRLSEYVIFPFTKRLSENMHVILNSNNKDNNKINKILNIFKIAPDIIIKALLTNNLVRYSDQSNLMSAIAKSKASFITTESSNNIPDNLRSVPKSGIGRIDLITTPSGEILKINSHNIEICYDKYRELLETPKAS